jgi:hypothetical protein
MSDTPIYHYWYADPGASTAKYPQKDRERWESLETQLAAIYLMFNNGAITGWQIDDRHAPSTDPIVYITVGHGFVGLKYAETTDAYPLPLILPTGVDMAVDGAQYFVYGYETDTTAYDKSITFEAFTVPQSNLDYIYMGSFVMKTDSSGKYIISSRNETNRNVINVFGSISNLVNTHVHTGGTSPPKINLRLHTSGKLPGVFIDSSLDASQITTGKISKDRIEQISHNTLANRGVLTHDQIDTIITNLQLNVDEHLSEVAMSNWLRDILAHKAIYLNFDEYLLNSFFYIPGVTDDSYVDHVGTTALIDTAHHQIVGLQASPSTSDFITWNGTNEFTTVYNNDYQGKNSNLQITSGGKLEIGIPLSFSTLYNRTTSPIQYWDEHIEITTTKPVTDAVIDIQATINYYKFYRLWSGTTPTSIDLTFVNKLQFGIKLVDPNVLNHGKIYFFLIGASHNNPNYPTKRINYTASVNNSAYTIDISYPVQILDTVEQTSGIVDDIKVVNIDLLQYVNRNKVQGFGFFITTDEGWDVINDYQFSLHQPLYSDMDTRVKDLLMVQDPYSVPNEGKIVMYVYNDLYHYNKGIAYFRFSQVLMTQFDYVYWGVTIPTVPNIVTVPYLTVKTITASAAAFLPETTPDLVSPIDHIVQSDDNKYIDILLEFGASSDRRYTPSLDYLTLYYTIASTSNSKSFSTAVEFAKALKLINISILTNPDNIELTSSDLVNAMYFLEGNTLKVIDEDKHVVPALNFDGSTCYTSPRQVFAKSGRGFRHPRCLSILEEGFLIADTYNDRVLEIDFNGDLVFGIQGNVYLPAAARDFVALSAIYNDRLGKIYVAFSQNINSSFVKDKFTLTTVDRSNSIQFLTDDDGIFETVPNPSAKSAVLMITLGAARKQQVDSWAAAKILLISKGALSGVAGSTSSQSPQPPGVNPSGGTGSSTPAAPVSAAATTTEAIDEVVTQSLPGEIKTVVISEAPSTAITDETNTFDFDADGTIDSVTLIDVDGNSEIVTVIVDDADVIYANVQYPLSVQKDGDNNYIIAQDYSLSVLNLGNDESVAWSLLNTLVSFDYPRGGNAVLQADDTLICASPEMKKVMQIVPLTQAVLLSYTPKFTPVHAFPLVSGNIIVVENDETNSSLNSRVFEIDTTQDVITEWGLGRLSSPTGVYVLSNNNWLISS